MTNDDYTKLINVEYQITSAELAAIAEAETLAGVTPTEPVQKPGGNPVQNPAKNYFKLYSTPRPIYYNEIGANTSSDNDYYLDCRVADYETDEPIRDKIDNVQSSSNFPDVSKSMYSMLSFILVAFVCLCLYLLVIYVPKLIS